MEDPYTSVLVEELRGQFKAFGESLRGTREALERAHAELRLQNEDLGRKIDRVAVDVGVLKTDVAGLKTDVAGLKTDVAGLKTDVAALKVDVAALKVDVAGLKRGMTAVELRLTAVERNTNGGPPLRARPVGKRKK